MTMRNLLNQINLQTVRDWLDRIDGGTKDWRVRVPVVALPVCLLLMVVLLSRAGHYAAMSTVAAVEIGNGSRAIETALAASEMQSTVRPEQARETFGVGLVALQELSVTLERWLKQGRNTQQQASHAAYLAGLVADSRIAGSSLPGLSFWRAFSAGLAKLEDAVRLGAITTPEAKALVLELRSEYARLRGINVGGTTAAADTDVKQLAVAQKVVARMSTQLNSLQQLQATTRSLQRWAMAIATIAIALLAMLLYGLWNAFQQRGQYQLDKVQREQGAILQLLDDITPLASGDLRVQANVSEAMTGAIADAVNFAVSELRRLVRAITESATLVRSSVNETRESAQQLAQASSVQAREIHRSSNYLNVMSDTMAQLSAHAVESSRIADKSVRQAQAGGIAVHANVDGLLKIREQTMMTTRLMQRLLDTSEIINDRVAQIRTVARSTELLALNTTIRASKGPGAGGADDLTRLSDEVSHLSEALAQATGDIAGLTDIIHQDATLTLGSMQHTCSELDKGQARAREASDSLDSIEKISAELNGLIADIASKSLRQAGVVKQLSANMGVINNITRESSLGLQGSADALERLQEITSMLRDSVADFKLPEHNASRTGRQGNTQPGSRSPAAALKKRATGHRGARIERVRGDD